LSGDTKHHSRDLTRELVTHLLKHALTEILNLLHRKLTTYRSEEMPSSEFVYLELGQTLHRFYAANPSMSSAWAQFCVFLENVTRSNIKIVQDLQGKSNHGNQEWSTLQQSMLFVGWICDVTLNGHVAIPESISELLLNAIPTFKLNVEFKKPESVSSTPNNDIFYQDAVRSTMTWGNSVSGYLGALWTAVAYFIQQSRTVSEPTGERGVLTVTSPRKEVLEAALEALGIAYLRASRSA